MIDANSFVHMLSYLEPVFCAFVLVALIKSQSVRKFPTLTALISLKLLSGIACLAFIGLSG